MVILFADVIWFLVTNTIASYNLQQNSFTCNQWLVYDEKSYEVLLNQNAVNWYEFECNVIRQFEQHHIYHSISQ